jgi:hypothetical protein
VAVSLGYIIGVTCHFLLNKFWVFRCNSQQYRRQLALYLMHAAFYWLMTMLIVSLVLQITAASVVVARLISIPPMMLFTFCFLRFVVFKRRDSVRESWVWDTGGDAYAPFVSPKRAWSFSLCRLELRGSARNPSLPVPSKCTLPSTLTTDTDYRQLHRKVYAPFRGPKGA